MAFVWGCLCLLVYATYSVLESMVEEDVGLPVVELAIPPEPEVKRFEDVIPPNSTMQDLLFKFGFTHQSIHAFIEDVRPVYNLNRIKAGKVFAVETRLDGRFQKFDYYFDEEEYLSVIYESGKYSASRHLHEFEDTIEEFYGEIETSLWDTLTSRGEKPQLVALLSQIFQWDIDFTLIQPGDSFKLMVEKKYLRYSAQFFLSFILIIREYKWLKKNEGFNNIKTKKLFHNWSVSFNPYWGDCIFNIIFY